MDIVKKLKFWRGLGKIFDTKIGSSISEASRNPINWMVSLAVSTNNDDIPWTPFNKPLSESSLAIISTAGFYLEDDKPFDVDSALGDASYRIIPSDVNSEKLKIAHPHYSHARVKKDINVLFPIDHLRELLNVKVIGRLATNFYSFGFGGNMTKEFIGESNGSAHQLVKELKADEVDYVLMVPA
ncbi:MAG: hypothetical protein DRH93_16610 [Deltaproteobacteria bacterium]|nr:MAG: hypothetical protein DRH93_16610 [Deltaproteobacteria bacterium]